MQPSSPAGNTSDAWAEFARWLLGLEAERKRGLLAGAVSHEFRANASGWTP